MEDTLLRRLANSYEAYQHFPFEARFERFKERKQYFLEGKEDAERVYREFIYFHYVFLNKLFPTLKMEEILKFYYDRKSEETR